MEEDQQVSFIEKSSIATSQMCIDDENGKMTLLIGKKKMKFDFYQSTPLTNEEMRACMKLESSFSPIKDLPPTFLQEDAF